MPREKSAAAEINDLVSDLPCETPFRDCAPRGRSYNCRVEAAKKCLSALAGGEGEMIGFMLAVLSKCQKMELWKSLSGTFAEVFKNFDDDVKRDIVDGLGWSHAMFGMAGLEVGERLFASRKGCGSPGRPKKVSGELEQQIDEALTACSTPISRVIKTLEGETAVRGMTCSYKEAFERSGLQDVMSYSSFHNRIGREYQHATRRTDVCDYCLAGQRMRHCLKQIVATHKKAFIDAEWRNGNPDPLRLQAILESCHRPKKAIFDLVAPIVEDLVEVQKHKVAADFQRDAYQKDYGNPPTGTVVVTLDFKSKGKLPMRPAEPSRQFYNQGSYSLLGFGLNWTEGGEVKRHHVDVLLRSLNQDAFVVLKSFEKVIELPIFPKGRGIIFWMDSGRHFHCKPVLSQFLLHSATVHVKYFCGKHGKNDRDGHFGWVSKTLKRSSQEVPILTLKDTAKVLETLPNTTAIELRLMPESMSVELFVLKDFTSLLSFSLEADSLVVGPHCSHKTFSVPVKKQKKVINFKPKVSAKLPRPPSDCDILSLCDSSEDESSVANTAESSDDENKVLLRALRRKHNRLQNAVDKLQAEEDKRTEKEKKLRKKRSQKSEQSQKKQRRRT